MKINFGLEINCKQISITVNECTNTFFISKENFSFRSVKDNQTYMWWVFWCPVKKTRGKMLCWSPREL